MLCGAKEGGYPGGFFPLSLIADLYVLFGHLGAGVAEEAGEYFEFAVLLHIEGGEGFAPYLEADVCFDLEMGGDVFDDLVLLLLADATK